MSNVVNDLRALYRNARRMARSDDVNVLLDYLVEDLVSNTGFERVLVLRLDRSENMLRTMAYYGFQHLASKPYQVPFSQVQGLLRKVYVDREPLNVIGFSSIMAGLPLAPVNCRILRDDFHQGGEGNRRPRINLCVPDVDTASVDLGQYGDINRCSMITLDHDDGIIPTLLGEIDSFLVLPICGDRHFYGYVLADKSLAGVPVSYEEIRLPAAITSHASYVLGQALKQKKMVTKISSSLEEIERLKSFYESIIQNLRSGMITVDKFMKISGLNRAAEVILGFDRDELIGTMVDDLFDAEDRQERCVFLDSADDMDACMGTVTEVTMRKKNHETFPAEVCFSVITDTNNSVEGLSCIFRDISARKVLENELARIDKLASLGELAAGVAHEIKNPLAGIAGALQVLSRSFDQESPHQFIFNEVQSQVWRLDNFINDLLQFARPGQTSFSEIDLAGIIDKALFLTVTQINGKEIKVSQDLADDLPLIEGDESQLQQVFLNIIINAVDAMETGGSLIIGTEWLPPSPVDGAVKCQKPGCGGSDGRVAITFRDDGKGIEPESMETIFNPFHTTKSNGTGLGLSISHRIMEQHGGTIDVDSRIGIGSSFIVYMPVCRYDGGDQAAFAPVSGGQNIV